jgi:hypothetical protein
MPLGRADNRRRCEVQRWHELGTASLEHPGPALLAGDVPAEKLLEDLAMGARDGCVRKICEQGEDVVERRVRTELPATLDNEMSTLGQRDDRLEAASERARDDSRDLAIRERPDELASHEASGFVQPAKPVYAG